LLRNLGPVCPRFTRCSNSLVPDSSTPRSSGPSVPVASYASRRLPRTRQRAPPLLSGSVSTPLRLTDLGIADVKATTTTRRTHQRAFTSSCLRRACYGRPHVSRKHANPSLPHPTYWTNSGSTLRQSRRLLHSGYPRLPSHNTSQDETHIEGGDFRALCRGGRSREKSKHSAPSRWDACPYQPACSGRISV
jgi:hypothetical protein